jgi:hypothetical protein
MHHGADPLADLYRLMDEAGLDGSLLTQKGPFMKGVVGARTRLAVALVDYISRREVASFNAGAEINNIQNKQEI